VKKRRYEGLKNELQTLAHQIEAFIHLWRNGAGFMKKSHKRPFLLPDSEIRSLVETKRNPNRGHVIREYEFWREIMVGRTTWAMENKIYSCPPFFTRRLHYVIRENGREVVTARATWNKKDKATASSYPPILAGK
jgi:hypothetical protein